MTSLTQIYHRQLLKSKNVKSYTSIIRPIGVVALVFIISAICMSCTSENIKLPIQNLIRSSSTSNSNVRILSTLDHKNLGLLATDDHATDDHATADDHHGSDDHSSGHFKLIGAIPYLDIFVGTVSVLMIVCAVQSVEYLFHSLHVVTHDTPFHEMVQSIEKELMVVGFTAFVFKILVNSTHFLELDWFHSLEYADILIPIFSFSYCGLGMTLILASIRTSNTWSQAHHHNLLELLSDYFNLPGFDGILPYGTWLTFFSPTIARMEFRIFQNIFCETYKIQKAAFAFNEYVEKVFEKYILMIIEIRPLDWLLVCVLVLLNWLRHELRLDYHDCHGEDSTVSTHCAAENGKIMFTIAGAVIFGITVMLALESRRLEVSIMRQKGIRSIHMYPSYLKYMEESAEVASADQFHLNAAELKASAEEVKYASSKKLDIFASLVDRNRRKEKMLQRLSSAYPGFAPAPVSTPTPSATSHSSRSAVSNKKKAPASHKFGASVKQMWVSKKNTSKRERRTSLLVAATEASVVNLRSGLRNVRQAAAAVRHATGSSFSAVMSYSEKSGKVFDLHSSSGSIRGSLKAASTSRKVAVIEEHEAVEDDQESGTELFACARPDGASAFLDSIKDGLQDFSLKDVPATSLVHSKSGHIPSGEQPQSEKLEEPHSTASMIMEHQSKERLFQSFVPNRGSPALPSSRYSGSDVEAFMDGSQQGSGGRGSATDHHFPAANKPRSPSNYPGNPPEHSVNSAPVSLLTRAESNARVWAEEETAIADVFFLSWPELYLEGVQSLIMIIALYYALYFTNFIASSGSSEWKLLTLVPAVLSSILLIYIVKCAAMLSALHAVDCDAILEVLEQTEGARQLSQQIRDNVIAKLQVIGVEPQAELIELFAQIDMNGNGCISREEFAVFIGSIDIHADRRQWMQVFRGIDKDFNHKVSFEEFFLFLFPEHTVGMALQKKKERLLEARVQQRAEKRATSLNSHGRSVPTNFEPL